MASMKAIGPDELVTRGRISNVWKIRNDTIKAWLADREVPIADIPGEIKRYRWGDVLAAAGIGNPDKGSIDADRARAVRKADDDHRSKLTARSLKF